MIKIYYASPFFDAGGYMKSQEVVDAIRKYFRHEGVRVYLPQENGEINDKKDISKLVTARDIANGDNEYLDQADILIADLDGVEIDSGVSAEIGYVTGRNREREHQYTRNYEQVLIDNTPTKIIGFNTDMRINPSNDDIVELIKQSDNYDARMIIDNLKVNNLYRNLYTIGLVEEWGEYIVSQDDYIEQILRSIEDEIRKRRQED